MPDHREWLGRHPTGFKTEEARSGEPLLSMERKPSRGGRARREREREERMMGLEPTTFCMASRRSSQLSYIRAKAKYSPRYAASKASLTSLSASSLWSRRTAL